MTIFPCFSIPIVTNCIQGGRQIFISNQTLQERSQKRKKKKL